MNDAGLIFLIGGHDLEMSEIRRIIEKCGILFYDYNLEWDHAKLSAYSNIFNHHNTFVGIELVTDIDPPPHYILIDHHNENADRPSSLEQVADLLKINLSRRQLIIAANDKGYIPAMLELGATQEEIEEIRLSDRKAQGVTNEDERLAEVSVHNYLTREQDLVIVASLTSKFSTITDRLYPCNRLLIYTDHELTYYGKGVMKLVHSFGDLIKQQKAYSGGDKNLYQLKWLLRISITSREISDTQWFSWESTIRSLFSL